MNNEFKEFIVNGIGFQEAKEQARQILDNVESQDTLLIIHIKSMEGARVLTNSTNVINPIHLADLANHTESTVQNALREVRRQNPFAAMVLEAAIRTRKE